MPSNFGVTGMAGIPGLSLDDWSPFSSKNKTHTQTLKKKPLPAVPESSTTPSSPPPTTPRKGRLLARRPSLRNKSSKASDLRVDMTCLEIPVKPETPTYSPLLPSFSTEQATNQFPPSPRDSVVALSEQEKDSQFTRVVHYGSSTKVKQQLQTLRLGRLLRQKSQSPTNTDGNDTFPSTSSSSKTTFSHDPTSDCSGSSSHSRDSSSSSFASSPSSATSLESMTFVKPRDPWRDSEQTIRPRDLPSPTHTRSVTFDNSTNSPPPQRVEHAPKPEPGIDDVIVIAPKPKDRRRRSWSVTSALMGKESSPEQSRDGNLSPTESSRGTLRIKTSMPMLGLMARSATPDPAHVTSFNEPEPPLQYLATAAAFKNYLDEACLQQYQPTEYRSFTVVKKGKKATTNSKPNILARLFSGNGGGAHTLPRPKTPAMTTPPFFHGIAPRFVEDLPRQSTSDSGDWSEVSRAPSPFVRTVDQWTEGEFHQTIEKLRRLR